MNKILLQAKNLSHSFEYELYKDLNLTLKSKGSIALLGVSGSGKSTILNNLSTLLKPKSGSVNLFGDTRDVYSLNQNEILELRRKQIGIIFQAHYLFRGFSALENLEVSALLADTTINYDLLEKMQISNILHQNIGSLSGGQQQRLSCARILTKNPSLIIADEPTGNLDKNTAQSMMDAIFTYIHEKGAGLVLATHDENIANRCEQIYRLENKQLIAIKE